MYVNELIRMYVCYYAIHIWIPNSWSISGLSRPASFERAQRQISCLYPNMNGLVLLSIKWSNIFLDTSHSESLIILTPCQEFNGRSKTDKEFVSSENSNTSMSAQVFKVSFVWGGRGRGGKVACPSPKGKRQLKKKRDEKNRDFIRINQLLWNMARLFPCRTYRRILQRATCLIGNTRYFSHILCINKYISI